jgi:diguanylate cyclase (GGDEF)-like protein
MDPAMLEALLARETRQRETLAGELMTLVSEVPGITESLAAWLNQLSEPLAREAVADQAFFQDKHHPLREIVDGLGHLQMFRAVPDLNPADDPVQRRVGEMLRPISSGTADRQTLRSVADAVRDLVTEHSSRYQRNVERVAQACEGRDRVRRAHEAVSGEIRRRYAGRRVPELLPQLLDVGWRAVMELAALNAGGSGGSRYPELLGLMDSLVGRLGGQAFEPDTLEPDANRLFVRIAKDLTTVAFDPIRRNVLETRMRKALADPEGDSTHLVVMPEIEGETDQVVPDSRPDGISEKVWTQVIGRCRALSVGDRVRMLDAADTWQELRVAWIRSDQGVYALVDYRGLKVREIDLAELALALHRHRVELGHSDGRALSDRGVDAMLARMQDRLAHQAAHDSLTGLMNRQQFHAALEQALATPDRAADSGVVLWVDIDQFRLVNDIYGYDTGDRLLVALARQLEAVGGAGLFGHMGADRFGLILNDIDLEGGERRAREVCESVRAMTFDWSGPSIALSVSLGVVGMDAARAGASQLLQAADDALAAAKAAGGDRAYVYRVDDPEITRRKESVRWVVQVDEALDRGQLRLRCQPIVPVRPDRGLSAHYEVLLGVHNDASQPLPIAEFIDAAERYNRMRAVDRWVAQTVMEWVAAHRGHMPALHGFAVNLSGQTVSDPGFVDFVRQQFQRTGIEPSWLSFEVTETAAVADLTRSAGIIHELKSLGCKVALDDFGSGRASYSYLKELPVDWLKIDGVFVRKIAADREDHAVVRSINEIGHFLGKKTIAEYVADDDILRLVREMGVDYAQGFGISPPLLMDDLPQTLLVASTG